MLRAEVLAAYTNALFLFAVTAYIMYEAVTATILGIGVSSSHTLLASGVDLW